MVASAVVLRRFRFTVRIDDSKKLSPQAREAAYREILPCAEIGIGFVGAEEIDRTGIHAASQKAMLIALQHLPRLPQLALIDGLFVPSGFPVPAISIVGGDGKSFSIACASIVAKVVRDRMMRRLHQMVPQYGFHRHKGYPTAEHLKVLRWIGPTFFHRFSFRPVSKSSSPRKRGSVLREQYLVPL